MSGLRANQAALSIVSSNVANAQTPGYVAQTANQIEVTTGGFGSTVLTTGVSRALDSYVQGQLRTETSGGGYADQTANILGQLQNVYGTPGGAGTLESALSTFTTALQALSGNPGTASAQTFAVTAAQSRPGSSTRRRTAFDRFVPTSNRTSASRWAGQHRDGADCANQQQAAGTECRRSDGSDADGSARQRDRLLSN
jgi:hypothetical protein